MVLHTHYSWAQVSHSRPWRVLNSIIIYTRSTNDSLIQEICEQNVKCYSIVTHMICALGEWLKVTIGSASTSVVSTHIILASSLHVWPKKRVCGVSINQGTNNQSSRDRQILLGNIVIGGQLFIRFCVSCMENPCTDFSFLFTHGKHSYTHATCVTRL